MYRSKSILAQLMLVCFFATSCASHYTETNSVAGVNRLPAQEVEAETSDDEGEEKKGIGGDIGQVVKEIYVKGSIDGKSLFMVYGFEDAFRDMKAVMKNAVKVKHLNNLGEAIYDKEHQEDYVNAVKDGVEFSKESGKAFVRDADNIIKWPSNSVKRMKHSYKVSFDNAREAKAGANNEIVGTLKYAGHAIWANVKGAYFLVVEIPVVAGSAITVSAVEGAGAVLGVPTAIVLQTLRVAWRTFKVAFNIGVMLPLRAAIAGIEGGYALLSTTTASTLTIVAAGGLAVFKGAKWVISSAKNSVIVQGKSDVDFSEQEAYAKKVGSNLEQSVLSGGLKLSKSDVEKYASKFILKSGEVEEAVRVKLTVVKRKVVVSAEATKKFIKSLKEEGKKKKEIKAEVEKLLRDLVDDLVAIE